MTVRGLALAPLGPFQIRRALVFADRRIGPYGSPCCSSRSKGFVDVGRPRWARRKTSGADAKVLGGPVKRRVFFAGQEELQGTVCAVGLDLCQRFLSLDSPKPERLTDAVAMQGPCHAVADRKAFFSIRFSASRAEAFRNSSTDATSREKKRLNQCNCLAAQLREVGLCRFPFAMHSKMCEPFCRSCNMPSISCVRAISTFRSRAGLHIASG
jgi:hypothetical protein